jgi:transposase-like protein
MASKRSEYWREQVAEQARSGLSVRQYCERAQIGEQSFYAWRRRLRRDPEVRFALVEPQRSAGAGGERGEIELRLASGEQLWIGSGTEEATLRMVLAALRG